MKEKKESPASSLRWKLVEGIFFGFLSLCFLLTRREGFYHTQDYVFHVMAILCFGGLSVASLGSWLKKSWAERLEEIVLTVIFPGLMIGIIIWIFKAALAPEKYKFILRGWEPTVLILLSLWIVSGLLFMFKALRRSRKESPLLVLFLSFFYPLIVLMTMPRMIVLLCVLVVFIALGNFVGRSYHHPYIGATLGIALFIALVALFSSRFRAH